MAHSSPLRGDLIGSVKLHNSIVIQKQEVLPKTAKQITSTTIAIFELEMRHKYIRLGHCSKPDYRKLNSTRV